MFDRENSEIVWVSPSHEEVGYGTWEQPFSSIEMALKHLQPGFTLVLKAGVYEGNVTFQISGTARQPIRITADENACVEIENGCWFFYDTSDLIVSNLVFKNVPHGAISVIGFCNRNRFESLQFKTCGSAKKASCTMYFGGSGGVNNIIEDCVFEGSDELLSKSQGTLIALMISEGDQGNGAPIKNHIIRRNTFSKYGYGVLIGSSNSNQNQYGHIVEYNHVEGCVFEGLLIKCGDTLIRGNRVENCSKNSICVAGGNGSIIDSNRIESCNHGVRVSGAGHSVVNNCIIKCKSAAVTVCGQSDNGMVEATNLFIENNTFVHCGIKESDPVQGTPGIQIEPGTTCIIRKNLIYGHGEPIFLATPDYAHNDMHKDNEIQTPNYVADDNITSWNGCSCKGFVSCAIEFTGGRGSFENTTDYGASGWVLTLQTFDPDIDNAEGDSYYVEAAVPEDDDSEFMIPDDTDSHQLFQHLYGYASKDEELEIGEE